MPPLMHTVPVEEAKRSRPNRPDAPKVPSSERVAESPPAPLMPSSLAVMLISPPEWVTSVPSNPS